MKRTLLIVGGALLAIGILYVGIFYWRNLRGVLPALKPTSGNIVDLLGTPENPLKAPQGFSISIFAKDLGAPRVMTYDSAGTMLVSIPEQGKVIALPNKDSDGKADSVVTVIDGLNEPHGLTMACLPGCKLYIAETDEIASYMYDPLQYKALNKTKLVDLPAGSGHSTRTIMFMPYPNENILLVSIGSSCNVCHESDDRRAKVFMLDVLAKEKVLKPFATGLRNSVFMAIHPVNGKIWATEMGRDLLGDDIPPDEINILENGKNYGWPICYGKNIHDADFDKNTYIRNPCMEPFETGSYIDVPAHSAPLGIAFVPEEGWPEDYWYNAFVAYHGSWNRSVPTGYKIVRYKLDAQGNVRGSEDLITGWLDDKGNVFGRPVDILIQPGGVMYVSDDKAGVIYRITYNSKVNLIRVSSPKENDVIKSPFVVEGVARGNWFFEASFPVKLLDGEGNEIARIPAQAQSDWMTENFVPFKATLEFATPKTQYGTLVLEKDNPSGLPEYADEIRIPVRFNTSGSVTKNTCKATGCSGQICSDKDVVTTCEYTAKYACYASARCERQSNGLCGWTETPELKACLTNAQ